MLPAELSAASVLIGFWNKSISGAVWITICLIVVVAINLMGAGERFISNKTAFQAHYVHTGVYGEAEFIFAQVWILRFV